MKTSYFVLAISLSALVAGSVMAADVPKAKTRSEVRAELAEAIRNGDIVRDEHGRTERELAPHRYPARSQAAGKTRDQVKFELAEAIRNGDIVRDEHGRTERELAPHRYPAHPQVAGKTRDQVREELAEAILLGDTPIDEQGRTPAERFPHVYAKVRAEHAMALNERESQETAQGADGASVLR